MTDAPQPAPISNVPLLAASDRLGKAGSAEALAAFHQELLSATLLLAVAEPPGPDGALSVVGLEGGGRRGFAVFSDEEALRSWRTETPLYGVALPSQDIFALALKAGAQAVFINPAGPAGAAVLQPAFAALSEGRVPPLG